MILVVDDMEEVRELTAAQLGAFGYGPIVKAGSAEEALALLEAERTDGAESPVELVLMDIMLPGLDGISAICLIKENPRLADIPVITISTLEDEETLNDAFIAGALDYLVKPVSAVALRARVQSALRLRTEARRRRAREGELAEMVADRRHRRPARHGDEVGPGWPGLSQYVQLLAQRARHRHPGPVLLAAIDDYGRLEELDGADPAAELTRRIIELAAALPGRIGDILIMAGDGRLAILFDSDDMRTAQETAHRLTDLVGRARIPHPRSNAGPHISLSIGLGQGVDAGAQASRALDMARAEGGARIVDGTRMRAGEETP
ncbi:response regulator [Niveispirillum fermenti]|uniref:response regulator n=1 Tax=Niveispirillum fermenti TaxID=1233113 RepID=UPI003A8AA702